MTSRHLKRPQGSGTLVWSTQEFPGNAELGSITVSQINQITNLNTELCYLQLDLSKMESFWFDAERDGTKFQGFLVRPPGFDAAKKYRSELRFTVSESNWGDAWSFLECRTLCRQRLRHRHDQSARLDGLRGRPLSTPSTATERQAFRRPDDRPRLRRAALSLPSTRRASARWAQAPADTWPTGSSATPTASSAL